jgi:hypothetical protein
MKGSWIKSARNIKVDGRTLDCELRNSKGEWIPNRVHMFPYEYTNIDGKFRWENCTNQAELDNTTHLHISRRHKKISIQRCLDNLTHEYDEWFVIEESHIQYEKSNCLSISLFHKNVNNTYENEFPKNEVEWKHKYYDSLIRNLNTYKYTNMCVNLYLANDLKEHLPTFLKYPFVNVFVMKSSSIGAQPGMLWRLMELTNSKYTKVFVADIDEPWDWVNGFYPYSHKVCTVNQKDVLICNSPYTPAYNFATIIGSHIMVTPSKFNYNIVDVIKGFISLCKKRETSNRPWGFDDTDPITLWNHPVRNHIYGWGRIITMYGFDELFLKHVIYFDAYPDFKFI